MGPLLRAACAVLVLLALGAQAQTTGGSIRTRRQAAARRRQQAAASLATTAVSSDADKTAPSAQARPRLSSSFADRFPDSRTGSLDCRTDRTLPNYDGSDVSHCSTPRAACQQIAFVCLLAPCTCVTAASCGFKL